MFRHFTLSAGESHWLVGWLAGVWLKRVKERLKRLPPLLKRTTPQNGAKRWEPTWCWLRKFSAVHLLSSNLVLVELPSPPYFSFGRRWQVDESECFKKSNYQIGLSCARLYMSWDSNIEWNKRKTGCIYEVFREWKSMMFSGNYVFNIIKNLMETDAVTIVQCFWTHVRDGSVSYWDQSD